MEWLKELLKGKVEEDKIDGIVESFNKEFPKHAVRKVDFNEKNEELKNAKQLLEGNKTLMESLKEKAGSVEEYEDKIKTLQTTLVEKEANFNKEVSTIKTKSAYKELLINSGMNKAAVDLVVNATDYSDMKLNDQGKIDNSEGYVTKLKEERAPLFNEVVDQSQITDDQHQADPQKSDADLTMAERFEKMGVKPLNRRYT